MEVNEGQKTFLRSIKEHMIETMQKRTSLDILFSPLEAKDVTARELLQSQPGKW